MLLISHRGNVRGKQAEFENSPPFIDIALQKFYVEIDIRRVEQHFWLGHDNPQYKINEEWLLERKHKLIIHCKDIESLSYFSGTSYHYFWHQEDKYTLTSAGLIWAYPGMAVNKGARAIAVMPENFNTPLINFSGICSDYISEYDKTNTI